MPRRQAVTAADWADAEKSNVRVLPDGTAELALRTLLGNPGLLDTDDDGNPTLWGELIRPDSPNGWWVYDKWGSQNGRVTTPDALPLSQTTYTRHNTQASGITYLQTSTAPPGAPTITGAPSVAEVDLIDTLGLAAGWIGIALEWITASEAEGGLLSLPSGRVALNLSASDNPFLGGFPVLSEVPQGIYGLAVCTTAIQVSEANALNATTPLYVHSVYPASSLPTAATLWGPLRTDNAATLEAGPDPTDVDPIYLPDVPSVVLSTEVFPNFDGNHKIRVAWAFEGGAESAASPQTSVTMSDYAEAYTVTKPSLSTGSCTVLLDPVDRPSALSGVNHNQIRYSAPVGTPQDYRISQNAPRAVVKAGLTYTLWFYAKTNDITEAILFEMIFRDANGTQITDGVAVATITAGDHAWTRYDEQYTAPAGAVFLECLGHQVGEGEILITPPQLNLDSSPLTFDNGTIPSGLAGYIIPAWDTSPVEFESNFGLPGGFSSGAIEIDASDGVDYTLTWASSDTSPEEDPASGWTFLSDIEDVPFRDYLAAKIEMEMP